MATSQGGHLHMPASGGELGAPHLTALPADPRERVLAVFPLLPAAYVSNPALCSRVSALLDDARTTPTAGGGAAGPAAAERHAVAVDALRTLEEVHAALEGALGGEGVLWRGAAVRGCDVLADLAGGGAALHSPATRRVQWGGGKAAAGAAAATAGGAAPPPVGTTTGGQPEQAVGHRFLTG